MDLWIKVITYLHWLTRVDCTSNFRTLNDSFEDFGIHHLIIDNHLAITWWRCFQNVLCVCVCSVNDASIHMLIFIIKRTIRLLIVPSIVTRAVLCSHWIYTKARVCCVYTIWHFWRFLSASILLYRSDITYY